MPEKLQTNFAREIKLCRESGLSEDMSKYTLATDYTD